MTPKDVLDEARYVSFSDDGLVMAVWHGGHTINVYGVPEHQYESVDAITVGDFETGQTTLIDAMDGIEILFEERRKHK